MQQVLPDEAALVEIIRSLIDRIEVHPGKERGHCEVLIVGAWPKSFLSPNKKRPPPPRETAVRP